MAMDSIVTVSWWLIIPLISVGSFLHFLYDWAGQNRFLATFSAVNESYWEHIKIAVLPVAFLQIVLFALGGYRYASFIPAATVALYSIPIGMTGLVFLYKSVTKRNLLWLDIAVFALTIALAQVIFIALLRQLEPSAVIVVLAAFYLAGLLVSFLIFTLRPPREPDLFIDPITGRYGLAGHTGEDQTDRK